MPPKPSTDLAAIISKVSGGVAGWRIDRWWRGGCPTHNVTSMTRRSVVVGDAFRIIVYLPALRVGEIVFADGVPSDGELRGVMKKAERRCVQAVRHDDRTLVPQIRWREHNLDCGAGERKVRRIWETCGRRFRRGRETCAERATDSRKAFSRCRSSVFSTGRRAFGSA